MENHGIRWGIIGGISIVALSLVLYLIDPATLFGSGSWLALIIYIFAMVKAAQGERHDLGGYMTWGEALKPTFISFAVASLIYFIFFYILNNYIDPGLEEMQRQFARDMVERMSGFLGEERTEAAMEEAEEKDFVGPMAMGSGYLTSLIVPGFILASIVSAIVKKNHPEMI